MSLMVMRISLTTHLFSAAFLRSLWYKIAAKIRMLSNNNRQPAPMVAASAVVKLGYDDFVFFLEHKSGKTQNYIPNGLNREIVFVELAFRIQRIMPFGVSIVSMANGNVLCEPSLTFAESALCLQSFSTKSAWL